MKRALRALCAAAALAAGLAQGAITCTFSSTGFSAAYVPANPGQNITQSDVDVTCQRNAGGDGTTVNFTVGANNGVNAAGNQNRARLGATANRINYDLYADSGCSQNWRNTGATRLTGSITGLSGFTPKSVSVPWWGCIPAGQLGLASGTYTDTVTITLRYGGATNPTTTFPVSIFTPSSCAVTSAPGTVAFTYTAFGPVSNASTNFGVTCTNLLPYSMALSATTSVLVGLQYSLALSATSATGTGVQQGYAINGTMPAGQAGTCGTTSCSGSQVQTLTITY